ncbi:MAG: HD domain-containing protein [Coriobacteriia bacterium]|nr:HD domain-containing protein [Coriobacteriia bacterium]
MSVASSYTQAGELLRARLSAASFAHSERVADTARGLARAYGAEEDDAALAGLLHDWDRELSDDELRAAARAAGIESVDTHSVAPRLLHAQTAAADIASSLPWVSEAVLDAVAKHTVGAPVMSDLDMIVFVADMIEPKRSFEGVDRLRGLIGVSQLGELFAAAYQQSLAHLVSSRRHIHPDTVAVWNALVAKGGAS